jgi:hypothetical protein
MKNEVNVSTSDGGWVIFWWILLCAGEPDLYDAIMKVLERWSQ